MRVTSEGLDVLEVSAFHQQYVWNTWCGEQSWGGRWDSCEVNMLLPKKMCGSPALLCFYSPAVSSCWSGDRRPQSLLSSVTQTSLWFSASRWELRKTHEFQTAVQVLQISRKRGEDKRKGRQTEKESKGQWTQKGGKKWCVIAFHLSGFATRLAHSCIVMHFSGYRVVWSSVWYQRREWKYKAVCLLPRNSLLALAVSH